MRFGVAAAALLAGCTMSSVPVTTVSYGPQLARFDALASRSVALSNIRLGVSDRGPSWMAEGAASVPQLLYVSDWATNDVFVYDYTSRSAAGKLTGFRAPYGECTDGAGNVWITESAGFDVLEYAHGGNKPINRLTTNGYPIGCAVDSSRGDLAVANFTGKAGAGNVEVWKGGSGHPTTYRLSAFYYYWPPAYDSKGDLFLEGQANNGAYSIAELPHDASAMHAVAMPGATIHYAGATLWDGKYLGFTDQNSDNKKTTVIFRATVNAFTAKLVGRIHLVDDCAHNFTDVMQPFIVHGSELTVVGGNLRCSRRFDYWPYPAGGNPKTTVKNAPQEPFGQAVSSAR